MKIVVIGGTGLIVGSGSSPLAHCQAQAREKKLAMAGIADIGKALQHAGREGAEALDDFPRLLEASHMGIAGGEKAVSRRVGRKLLK